jgi:hypothetical protein
MIDDQNLHGMRLHHHSDADLFIHRVGGDIAPLGSPDASFGVCAGGLKVQGEIRRLPARWRSP